MPARFMKPIAPKKLRIDKVRLSLLNKLRSEGRRIVKEFEKTVATWDEKPSFKFLIGLSGSDASVIIGPTGPARLVEIYGYINNGTPPHEIQASGTGLLHFQRNYVAKTSPGIIGSAPGGSSGEWASKEVVQHPGIVARNFTTIIIKDNLDIFVDNIRQAVIVEVGP